jgi:hypothetical protein
MWLVAVNGADLAHSVIERVRIGAPFRRHE